jgi:hypothetical protein
VEAHLVREVDSRGIPAKQAASGTAVWLRERYRMGIHRARRVVDLAHAVDRSADLDRALSAGEVSPEQAATIAKTVAPLPAEVGADVAGKAERSLIEFAAQHEPAHLRRLGERIVELVAPDVAERADAEVLARWEARAFASRGFTLSPVGDGRVRLTGWLDVEAAALVTAALCSEPTLPASICASGEYLELPASPP